MDVTTHQVPAAMDAAIAESIKQKILEKRNPQPASQLKGYSKLKKK